MENMWNPAGVPLLLQAYIRCFATGITPNDDDIVTFYDELFDPKYSNGLYRYWKDALCVANDPYEQLLLQVSDENFLSVARVYAQEHIEIMRMPWITYQRMGRIITTKETGLPSGSRLARDCKTLRGNLLDYCLRFLSKHEQNDEWVYHIAHHQKQRNGGPLKKVWDRLERYALRRKKEVRDTIASSLDPFYWYHMMVAILPDEQESILEIAQITFVALQELHEFTVYDLDTEHHPYIVDIDDSYYDTDAIDLLFRTARIGYHEPASGPYAKLTLPLANCCTLFALRYPERFQQENTNWHWLLQSTLSTLLADDNKYQDSWGEAQKLLAAYPELVPTFFEELTRKRDEFLQWGGVESALAVMELYKIPKLSINDFLLLLSELDESRAVLWESMEEQALEQSGLFHYQTVISNPIQKQVHTVANLLRAQSTLRTRQSEFVDIIL